MSTDKTYVHESIYDEFLKTTKEFASGMVKDMDYDLPHRNKTFADNISILVSDAVVKGA